MEKAKQFISYHGRRIADHPLGFPVVLFLLLCSLGAIGAYMFIVKPDSRFNLRADNNYITILSDEQGQHTIPTEAKTVGEFLRKERIPMQPGDRVEPAMSAPITTDNFRINIYRSAPVAIVDGTATKQYKTASASSREAVQQAGMTLYNEDIVASAPTSNFVTQGTIGERLTIDRSMPVQFELYGTPATIHTHADTVADLLKQRNVKLTSEDTVKPALETPVTQNMKIAVIRNGIRVITITEEVAPPTENVVDATLSFGSQAVRQEGAPGKVTKTYKINVQGGNEISRELLQSVTIQEPVKRIVAKGNTVNIPANKQAVLAAAGISASDYAYVDYIFSRESHWNAAAVSGNGKYYGLGQTNLARLSGACPNWQNDPVCQTRVFTGYASRYGGWAGAYNFWVGHGWW